MTAPPMDPLYEQRLRDEVIYLHSLWHQGPPRAAAAATSTACHHLQPSQTTQFKREKKRRGKNGKKSTNYSKNDAQESNSSPAAEWPCPTPPLPASTRGWPSPEAKPDRKPPSLTPEDQSKLAGKHAHQHAIKVVREFMRSNNDDNSDAIDSSSDEDDDDLMDEDCGRDKYNFFFKVFEEDAELREYYAKNYAKGEFSCLVCGAIGGKKMGKKYKSCLALVQHSITIAKTKKKRAHRAFSQAVCKVLGWDIDQLPTITSLLSDKTGKTQENFDVDNKDTSKTFVNNVDSVEGENDEAQESEHIVTRILPNGDEGDMNSLPCHDAGKTTEDIGMMHLHKAEEPAAEGLTSNSLVCLDVDKTTPPNNIAPASSSSPAAGWMCPTPPPLASTSGWPSLETKPDPKPLSLSPEEQLKLAGKHAHQHALKVVIEFFRSNNDNDDDDSSSSSDEDDDLMDEDDGRNEYTFFFNVFKEYADLREYYEKNFAKGEFSCLVCGAEGGKKMARMYKSCLALAHHAITIDQTNMKRAHKGFAQAVCKVLGWDIDQLPTITSLLSDKTGETQENDNIDNKDISRTFVNNDSVEGDTVEDKNDDAVQESGPVVTGILPNGDVGYMTLTSPDSGKNLEDIGMVHPHKVEKPAAEGLASNSLVCPHNLEDPASEGLAINSLTCPDANKDLENPGMVYPHNVEEPALEGMEINSWMFSYADTNLENLGMVNRQEVEEHAPGLRSVPLHENITVGNEMQDLHSADG